MKLIGVTQRVEISLRDQERRDALDQRWASFLYECGYMIYPIPNKIELVENVFSLPLDGLVLTGGNSLHTDAPERDLVETALLEYAINSRLPLLGVCRGMQMILSYFGAVLREVKGHVVKSHAVFLENEVAQVNSYHNYGAYEVNLPLKVLGRSEDGVVEAVMHQHLPIKGVMWHPERHQPFTLSDKDEVKKIFGLKA